MTGQNRSILSALLDMGQALMQNGSEVNRVEDTLCRMAHAFGCTNVNVFAISNNIILTVSMPDGETETMTRRILGGNSTNYRALEELNELSRAFCAEPTGPSELVNKIAEIKSAGVNRLKSYIGSALVGGSGALFFGGGVIDAAAATVIGFCMCLIQRHTMKILKNNIVFNFLISFIIGVLTALISFLIPALSIGHVFTGDLMILIPGLAITVSILDVLLGDTVSGLMRAMESVLSAAVLAVGYALAMQLLGTENSTLDIGGQTVIVSIAASLFMSLGFALIYQLSMRHLIVTSVTGMSGWITFLICSHIGMQDFYAAMLASMTVAVVSEVAARIHKAPAVFFRTPAVMPLAPGKLLFGIMESLNLHKWSVLGTYLISTLEWTLGIAVGLCALNLFVKVVSGLMDSRRSDYF